MLEFPHPSRPGYYDQALLPATRAAVSALVCALIPGDDVYPSAAAARVPQFIEAHASPDEVELLENLIGGLGELDAAEAVGLLEEWETGRPDVFSWLRELAYHAYYGAPQVIAAMVERGYGYHGAPQPLGYRITEAMKVPSEKRGSFVPTSEVRRVLL